MTIFTRLLRLLTRTSQSPRDVELQLAERTQKTIKRYDEMLNANAKQREGRPHTVDLRNVEG
jgi:cytidylate kinase